MSKIMNRKDVDYIRRYHLVNDGRSSARETTKLAESHEALRALLNQYMIWLQDPAAEEAEAMLARIEEALQ